MLRDKGITCRAESPVGGGKHHDIHVLLPLGSIVAVIEAKKTATKKAGDVSTAQNAAIIAATGRIADKTASIALALCYPPDVNESILSDAMFSWSVIKHPFPDGVSEWAPGGLDELANVVLQLNSELGDPDALAEQLSAALKTSVAALGHETKRKMAKSLDLPANNHGSFDPAATRALLVVATAIMFHSRLDDHLGGAKPQMDSREKPPVPFVGEWPPMSARNCANDLDPVASFLESWSLILAVDYRPIFNTACTTLLDLSSSTALAVAVSGLADQVLRISQQAASLRHDLLGRIFHRILSTARFDGSFYTSTAAATLLAGLALREDHANWKSAASISNLRIADPACGTGTLLMAAAERMRDMTSRARGPNNVEKILIEDVLYGYDTNLTATHLAATTLGLLSPSTEFAKMNIERAFLGTDDAGMGSLGSLEFIPGGQPSLLGWAGGQQQVDSETSRVEEIPKFDLVIMNPPYTRDSVRYDQFSSVIEGALRRREKTLLRDYLRPNSNGEIVLSRSSQGNNFVVLATHLIKKNGGIAAVLPTATATNPSSIGIRRFIGRELHVEMIVISHDPKRVYFSENTGISEMLLICRKRKPGDETKPARVIALSVNPDTPARALTMANSIVRGKSSTAVEHEITAAQIDEGNWTAVQFLSPRLAALFAMICAGELFAVCLLGTLGNTLNGRSIRGAFEKSEQAQTHGMIALWDHKTGERGINQMAVQHDCFISVKHDDDEEIEVAQKKEIEAARIWSKRANLMLPARLQLPQVHAPSVVLSRSAVASAWYPFTLSGELTDDERAMREKAICIYINSTAGILSLLGIRDFKILTYPNFSKYSIDQLPVPNFAELAPRKIAALAAAFDEHAQSRLQHLRGMARCETRRAIDNAVASTLGIPRAIMDEIRELLPKEPSISGERYEALTLS